MAAEAELAHADLPRRRRATGRHRPTTSPQPFSRVRVEVDARRRRLRAADRRAGRRPSLRARSPARPRARCTLVVHDDSVLLNRDEKVARLRGQAAARDRRRAVRGARARRRGRHDPPTPAPRSPASSSSAAPRCSCCASWRAATACSSTCARRRSPGSEHRRASSARSSRAGDLPELRADRRRPQRRPRSASSSTPCGRCTARAGSVAIADKSVLTRETRRRRSRRRSGDEPAHERRHAARPAPCWRARARSRPTSTPPPPAAVDLSSLGATARTARSTPTAMPACCAPHRSVRVAGVGTLSGDYLISRVTHTRSSDGALHGSSSSLRRNARSAGAGGGADGFPSGIF